MLCISNSQKLVLQANRLNHQATLFFAIVTGFEPITKDLTGPRSAIELHYHLWSRGDLHSVLHIANVPF